MIEPLGINIKDTDYNIVDGAMEKLINWHWRDGALRPLPERLESGIDVSGYHDIIMHKVGDEDQVNVLGYDVGGDLVWFGKIINNSYSALVTPVQVGVQYSTGVSYTILNGLLYFMGDGSSVSEQYYYRLQYNNVSDEYELRDMYAWKGISFIYDREVGMDVTINGDPNGDMAYSVCGIILIRFAFVLKTGEVVLHSPMYPFWLHGINISDSQINATDTITNIHTYIPFNLQLTDESLYDDEFVAVNVYASTPYYQLEETEESTTFSNVHNLGNEAEMKGEIIKKVDQPFYLIQTISKEEFNKGVILYAGKLSNKIEFDDDIIFSHVDMNTIAAGEIMPVDNYSYHKVFGKIKSSLNRIVVQRPRTVLSNGHFLMLTKTISGYSLLDKYAYVIGTEDGDRRTDIITEAGGEGIPFNLISGSEYYIYPNGIISYPDSRATALYITDYLSVTIHNKLSEAKTGNISCSLQMDSVALPEIPIISETNGVFTLTAKYWGNLTYRKENATWTVPQKNTSYVSDNRIQYSLVGESSVFPAVNSYRIGEGRIMTLGSNMVDPANADVVAVETVGTSDGIYTLNIDQSGNTLISSITRTESLSVLSMESLLVEGSLIMVTDKGLVAVNNGKAVKLSYDFFPGQYHETKVNATRYPNYDLISDLNGNSDYDLSDIIQYLKGSLLAYDGRRNTVWCSNHNESFSLIFSPDSQMWSMSTRVFKEKPEFFGSLDFVDYGTIYSRYLTLSNGETKLRVLSGEENRLPVFAHFMTRPIKVEADRFKKIRRMFTRCELYRYSSGYYIGHGVWGKQDLNIDKQNIPVVSQRDNREEVFPGGVRQDIPIGPRKGKYKGLSILLEGNFMPDSAVYGFDIDIEYVNDKKLR